MSNTGLIYKDSAVHDTISKMWDFFYRGLKTIEAELLSNTLSKDSNLQAETLHHRAHTSFTPAAKDMGSESTSIVKRTSVSPKKNVKAVNQHTQLNPWVLFWFYVTAVICTWDATFIMLRPHTLPGGSLAWFWYLYKYYVVVDQRYQDTNDAYVFAQSLLNYAEVIFNIITIAMHYKRSAHTTITAFMVSVMTMWKTVLYFLMFSEFCTGGVYRQGNTIFQEIFLVVIPNIIWVIAPLAAMGELWPKMVLSVSQDLKDIQVSENEEEEEKEAGDNVGKVNGIYNGDAVSCRVEKSNLHLRKTQAQTQNERVVG